MEPALVIRDLSKTFPGQVALSHLDLDVSPGEVRAVVGQNGSGKSTLVKLLAGFHHPDEGGSVTVGGKQLHLGTVGAGEAAGLRFVHQDLALVGSLSAVENIALCREYSSPSYGPIRWRHEAAKARETLRALGFNFDVTKPVRELVPSDRTGVAIARAITPSRGAETTTYVLVLDEPTATMPAPEVSALFQVIRRLKANGVAVLYISHHLSEVFEVADSVTVLRDGEKVASARARDLNPEVLIELIVGRRLEDVRPQTRSISDRREVILAVEGLSGSTTRDLAFTLQRGEVLGVAGLTGSGREELALMLFGGLPRMGTVDVGRKRLPPGRPDLATDAGMALVPTDRSVNAAFLDRTTRDNITLSGLNAYVRMGALSKKKEREGIEPFLKSLNVRPADPEFMMASMSGGNQQKVVMARCLHGKPQILIMEDPTQGVDVGAKAEIHQLIRLAASAGCGVVVVSADNEELARLADRVIVLRDGKIAEEIVPLESDSERLTEACLAITTDV